MCFALKSTGKASSLPPNGGEAVSRPTMSQDPFVAQRAVTVPLSTHRPNDRGAPPPKPRPNLLKGQNFARTEGWKFDATARDPIQGAGCRCIHTACSPHNFNRTIPSQSRFKNCVSTIQMIKRSMKRSLSIFSNDSHGHVAGLDLVRCGGSWVIGRKIRMSVARLILLYWWSQQAHHVAQFPYGEPSCQVGMT